MKNNAKFDALKIQSKNDKIANIETFRYKFRLNAFR